MGWLTRLLGGPATHLEAASVDASEGLWELRAPVHFAEFIAALDGWAPPGCFLYLEGGSPDAELERFMETHAVPERLRIAAGTLWPRPEKRHLPIEHDLLRELADIMTRHADFELAAHLSLYREGRVILSWHDAPLDPMRLSAALPEESVNDLACRLDGTLRRVV